MTPPASGDFSWVNQGSATVADTKGMMVVTAPSSCVGRCLALPGQDRPGDPLRNHGRHSWPRIRSTQLLLRSRSLASAGGRAVRASCLPMAGESNNYPLYFLYAQWTNPDDAFRRPVWHRYGTPPMAPYWVRFGDDGTYRTVKMSSDGFNWVPVQPPQGAHGVLHAESGRRVRQQLENRPTASRA